MKRFFSYLAKHKIILLCCSLFLFVVCVDAWINRRITVSFGANSENTIEYQIFWTTSKHQHFSEEQSIKKLVSAGYNVVKLDLPTHKISNLRIDFGIHPGKVQISHINVKGVKTKELRNFADFEIQNISDWTDNKVHLEIHSDHQDPHIVYKKTLQVYSGIHISLWFYIAILIIYLLCLRFPRPMKYSLLVTPFLLLLTMRYFAMFKKVASQYANHLSWEFFMNFFSQESLILLIVSGLLGLFFCMKRFRFIVYLLMAILFCIITTDYVVLHNLNSRFIFSEFLTYRNAFDVTIAMLKKYMTTPMYGVNLLLLANFIFIFVVFRQPSKKLALGFLGTTIILAINSQISWSRGIFDRMFYNVFDANFNNHQSVKHSNQEILQIRHNLDLQPQCVTGQNTRKNMILIVVESLSSYKVKSFNGIENVMPKLDKIAAQGISFTHYYSNSYKTTSGLFSILSGNPMIHDYHNLGDLKYKPYYERSLPKRLAKHGYKTRYFQAAEMTPGKDSLIDNSGFSTTSFSEDPFYKDKPRIIFNGVSDDVLFKNVLRNYKAENKNKPFAYVVLTLTSHGPYIDPISKKFSYDKTLSFVDDQLDKFITKLKQVGFFKNGIVVITGDHRAMLPINPSEYKNLGVLADAAVPLIILGTGKPSEADNHLFSHTDLAPSLEYYLTNNACFNSFQKNIFDSTFHDDVCTIYSYLSPQDRVRVYCSENKYSDITLNGDKTTVDDESLKPYRDYIIWLRTLPKIP